MTELPTIPKLPNLLSKKWVKRSVTLAGTVFVLVLVYLIAFHQGYQRCFKEKKKVTYLTTPRQVLGLRINNIDYTIKPSTRRSKSVPPKKITEIRLPFGLNLFRNNFSLIFVRRELTYTESIEELLTSAINTLLYGPTKVEDKKGLYSLVSGKLLSVRVNERIAYLDFTREFSTGSGTLTFWRAVTAIEETVRQIPEIDRVIICIEGKKCYPPE